MKQQAKSLAVAEPSGWQSLLNPVQSKVAKDIKITNAQGVDAVLQGWALAKPVRDFLANIKYAESVDYQTFRFTVQQGRSTVDEFVASGRNYDGKVQLAYIKVSASATAKTQYVTTTSCRRIMLFFKKCRRVHTARGFNTGELQKMQNAMLSQAYKKLTAEVNQLAVYVQAVPLESFEVYFN